MLYKKIILAGGSGFLGKVLAKHFAGKANEVIILSRRSAPVQRNIKTIVWDAKTEGNWAEALKGADLLVNLCGKNVNCRYTKANKAQIYASRLQPTALLDTVLSKMTQPPRVWINITSATIYRHAEDCPQDEITGEVGTGFSVEVCRAWEQTFFEHDIAGVQKIALRMGIVLGKSDSAFPRLLNLVRLGLGGKQGNGLQMVSWIHEDDAAHIVEWLMQRPFATGVYNCTAPNPVNNNVLMQTIRKVCGINMGLPCPAWLLKIGAWLIGTETELILKSRWVLPARLLHEGYNFRYPQLVQAIEECVKNK